MGNVALGKTTYCSERIEPFNSGKAVDGQVSAQSRWLCKTIPGWLTVDLGAPCWINRWVLKHMGAISCPAIHGRWDSGPDYNMVDFKLQKSSDDSNWVDVDSVTNNTNSITDHTLNPFKARYLRVYVTKGLRTNIGLAAIAEFEAYEAVPTSSSLTSLTISSGTLDPTFNKTTYAYTDTVSFDTATITVTPTAEDSAAAITVNGTSVRSGSASPPISLVYGDNTVTIQVTPTVGDPRNYVVTVNRPRDVYLTHVVLDYSGRGVSGPVDVPMDHSALSYTANVPGGAAQTTLTPYAEDNTVNIVIGAQTLKSGEVSAQIALPNQTTSIAVQVRSSDGQATRDYTINVVKG